MATPQLSPGVLVREVDLTKGRVDNVIDITGAIAGPFAIGPVNDPVQIDSEQQLIDVFGKPKNTDYQYQYWMSAASYLSYGGNLQVVRVSGTNLVNAHATDDGLTASVVIENYDDYSENHMDDTSFVYAAKNPGEWGNGLKVCQIDNFADQTVTIVGNNAVDVDGIIVGAAVSTTIDTAIPGAGSTAAFSGSLEGVITGITTVGADTNLDISIVSRTSDGGVETPVTYQEGARYAAFEATDTLNIAATTATAGTTVDWYAQQTLDIKNSTVYWSSIAPKPTDNIYVSERGGTNDALHVAVVDETGSITGIKGNILEKHISLSKASDAVSAVNSPQRSYYKDYIADFSEQIFAGAPQVGVTLLRTTSQTDTAWGAIAEDAAFKVNGNISYAMAFGADYGASGGMMATLGDIQTAYSKFANEDEIAVDFLIMGPSCASKGESQAKANYLIALAEARKDCMAVIGPHKEDIVGVSNSETQTDNLLSYFSPLSSSSYAVFDSGFKYTYDRFNNRFRYIPCNPDVAGMMARTGVDAYPWFSPAGTTRGILNNSIKLAYNPSKTQRDRLYPARINSFITSPGQGTFLFGDKTALAYASAFDRINVRRLFLTVEQAIRGAANAQLFELNDDLTRANFRNIVEPYLRDVQAKRGLYGFLVVCDESNNTPDIIDNNEFRADIYLQPTKSINYITLTFVATRTGISFEEVAGRV